MICCFLNLYIAKRNKNKLVKKSRAYVKKKKEKDKNVA